jgi:hypothetical protein
MSDPNDPSPDCGRNARLIAEMRNALPALLDEIEALRRVAEAARAWSECVDNGFASELRPDIARAHVNRALAALGALDGHADGGT